MPASVDTGLSCEGIETVLNDAYGSDIAKSVAGYENIDEDCVWRSWTPDWRPHSQQTNLHSL